jgi:TP901 family phage tail tape measure protein
MGVSAEALDIILRLQGVPTYTAGMSEAAGANDKFTASSRRAAQMSNEAAAASERQRGAAALLSKAAKGIGLTLAAAGVEGVKMAIKFEKQMEMIHTQAGASQAEVGRLKKEVLGLAGAVPQGPEELAKGLYHLESIGLRGANAMNALRIAAQGAAVGNTDLESTASALGAAWIVGIKGAGGFRSTMGVLNATVGAGNMRMGELVTALGSGILPVAKLTGLTIQDVGAALATLSDSGYSASSAAAQLGTSLHFLYSPTTKAKKALESIGLTSKQVFEQLQGPAGLHGALELLKSHLSGAGDHAEQMEKLGEIFPGGRGKVILTLLAELERLEMKRKQIIATGGNFGDSVTKTMEQPAVKIQKAWSKFQATLIELGLQLEGPATDAMTAFAGGLGLALHILMALTDEGKLLVPIIIALAGAWAVYKGAVMGAAIAQYAYDAAMGLLTIAALVGDITSLADAWFLLDAAMDANPIGLIALAIAGLIAGLVMLIVHWRAVSNFLRGPWGTAVLWGITVLMPWIGIPLAIAVHWKQVMSVLKSVIGFIKGGWHKLGPILAWPFEFLWGKISWVVKHMKSLFGGGAGGLLSKINFGSALKSIPTIGPLLSAIPHFAAGGTMPWGGLATINEGAAGETVYLPGGSTVQPSAASSLFSSRAHTPNPAPSGEGRAVYVEAYLEIPTRAGRTLYKLITKEAAIKEART